MPLRQTTPLPPPPPPPASTSVAWEAPPLGWIKLNVNDALSESSSALAVVARDYKGITIKAWSKVHSKSSPISAEASAILWAVQLALQERWNHIIVEGDAKNCIDPLSSEDVSPNWSIANIVSNVLSFKSSFSACLFHWVKRECNVVAHVTAKLSLNAKKDLCFNKDNFPGPLISAC